jgi:myo-inositol 2-dehydrogenase/D-chiro-inositol 1-dehydrogenase
MEKRIKLGIIGAGRIGKVHVESITYHVPGAEVKSLADVFINDELAQWAAGFGIENLVNDHREILDDDEIDAVLICSSTDTHAELVAESARAGKHIFCEKPVDLNVDTIKKTLKIVEEAGVKFQVGFQRRFDRNHKKVRDCVLQGTIGTPHIIKITSRDPAPPPIEYIKVSGGIFLDCTIHDFDMARYLSGSEVEEVFATGTCLVDQEIGKSGDVDTTCVVLKFKNGAIGIIDNSRQAVYGHDQRLEVFGSKGCVKDHNVSATNVVVLNEESVVSEKPLHFFLERYMEAYAAEIRDFIQAIVNDGKVACGGQDALAATIIAVAATESMKTGRPVKVELV